MDAGRSVQESVSALAAEFPDHARLIEAWWDRWPEMLGGEIAEAVAEVRRLAQTGFPLYALTNFAADTWRHAVERFAFLQDHFREIIVSGQERLAKPDPAIFNLTSERFGLNPSRTGFVDDSQANVETAASLGFVTHHFRGAELMSEWLGTRGLGAG